MKRLRIGVLLLAVLVTLSAATIGLSNSPADRAASFSASEKWLRTELYFGLSRSDGTTVTETEWTGFVDEVVTPRFPDGFTILFAAGQYRGKDNVIVREKSRVIVILYKKRDRKIADARIEEIRSEYKLRFKQESVLRVDARDSVVVSF